MKTYISRIKIINVKPKYKEIDIIMKKLKVRHLAEEDGGIQIKCLIKMQPHDVRMFLTELLNCSNTQIRIEYHEKN